MTRGRPDGHATAGRCVDRRCPVAEHQRDDADDDGGGDNKWSETSHRMDLLPWTHGGVFFRCSVRDMPEPRLWLWLWRAAASATGWCSSRVS